MASGDILLSSSEDPAAISFREIALALFGLIPLDLAIDRFSRRADESRSVGDSTGLMFLYRL